MHPITPSRQTIVDLLTELEPDTVVCRMDKTYTVELMIKELQQGTDIGRQFASNLLRVARDFLARQAKRASNVAG